MTRCSQKWTEMNNHSLTKNSPFPAIIPHWASRVESSYANNSRLYSTLGASASGAQIFSFLRWDAYQPPFFVYLEQWLPRAPAPLRCALEAHIREEVGENHSGLFRSMMAELEKEFSGTSPNLN